MSVTDELVELRGLRFHYRDWAGPAPDAPVLVLLHGYTGHARSWDAFAEVMSEHFRVLALDQRGHGESGWVDPPAYGTFEMVEDLQAFVAAVGLEQFSLLGLSMGGLVSIAYAGLRPAGLERLVIVDIAPEIAARGNERIRAGVTKPDVFATREAAFESQREVNPVPPVAHHRHRVEHALMRTADGQWTWRYDRALRDPEIPRERMPPQEGWRRVSCITAPTLLIRGELSDVLDSDTAARMVAELADGRMVEVPGSGHSVPLDKPEAFCEVARGFLLG